MQRNLAYSNGEIMQAVNSLLNLHRSANAEGKLHFSVTAEFVTMSFYQVRCKCTVLVFDLNREKCPMILNSGKSIIVTLPEMINQAAVMLDCYEVECIRCGEVHTVGNDTELNNPHPLNLLCEKCYDASPFNEGEEKEWFDELVEEWREKQ